MTYLAIQVGVFLWVKLKTVLLSLKRERTELKNNFSRFLSNSLSTMFSSTLSSSTTNMPPKDLKKVSLFHIFIAWNRNFSLSRSILHKKENFIQYNVIQIHSKYSKYKIASLINVASETFNFRVIYDRNLLTQYIEFLQKFLLLWSNFYGQIRFEDLYWEELRTYGI